ncbi:hypothetical protein [Hyphomonas jannaschiana]|uniref:Uncharacterized protein n=1 Tax=Hyphomonas jannaschiana VP2 TaxID=1280952 RepID=A0A059FIH7_9PROT|nr:hypothetical protein [Hyphomonas jannaschiana]KCZ90412.1 hypothetical protein HJA_04256 [Hyphomonas jannaschiana VP2]
MIQSISPLISHHRDELKNQSRLNRTILIGAMLAALGAFSIFLLTLFGHYPLPVGERVFSNNPERILGASNFFVATAIGAALRMWRMRQTRIKLLIAEAFLRENEEETGLRLLLEPMFGANVWRGTKLKDAGGTEW